MSTFCKPIVFVQVNHPDDKTYRPHVRLCLPDTTTFEEAFTAALAVEDAGERDGQRGKKTAQETKDDQVVLSCPDH